MTERACRTTTDSSRALFGHGIKAHDVPARRRNHRDVITRPGERLGTFLRLTEIIEGAMYVALAVADPKQQRRAKRP